MELILSVPPNEYSYSFCSAFEVSVTWLNFPEKVCWLSSTRVRSLSSSTLPCPRSSACPLAFGWIQPERGVAGDQQVRVFVFPAPPLGISLQRPVENPLQTPLISPQVEMAPHSWLPRARHSFCWFPKSRPYFVNSSFIKLSSNYLASGCHLCHAFLIQREKDFFIKGKNQDIYSRFFLGSVLMECLEKP